MYCWGRKKGKGGTSSHHRFYNDAYFALFPQIVQRDLAFTYVIFWRGLGRGERGGSMEGVVLAVSIGTAQAKLLQMKYESVHPCPFQG